MPTPRREIDMHQLEALMRFDPTRGDCAAFFKCSEDTIERRIKEHTSSEDHPNGLTFNEFKEQGMVHTRMSLKRKLIKEAESGNTTALIFACKTLGGLKENKDPDIVINNNNNILEKMSDEELDQKIAELRLVGETK